MPLPVDVVLPYSTAAEAEAAFAERLAPGAVFLPARLAPPGLDVGVVVRVALRVADGGLFIAFTGVTAWLVAEASAPAGREPGVGIVVGSVDDECVARWATVAGRAGAGSRVRIPGARLAVRQGLIGTLLPAAPAATHGGRPAVDPPTEAPLGSDDVFASPVDDTAGRPSSARLAFLKNALASNPGGSVDGDVTLELTAIADSPLDDFVSTAAPSSSSSPFAEAATPADGVAALADDELPFAASERAFEPQATDVDLLASLSAQDIVSLEHAPTPLGAQALDVDDLPSMDADLVEPDAVDDEGALPERDVGVRNVPLLDGWPTTETPLPPGPVGVAFTTGQRGVLAVESFAWASEGTKRPWRADVVGDEDGIDVFAPPAATQTAREDPFAPRATDPGLSVDNVVARAVRAAHLNAELDIDAVFEVAEPTRDGSPVAADDDSTGSGDAPASGSTSSEDTGDGPPR